MNSTERRRSTFAEIWAYGIDPTSHQPPPTLVANHWATEAISSHYPNFPAPDLTVWIAALLDFNYTITPPRRSERPGVIDTDRAARDYAQLTAPRRPYLPGDPRMPRYRREEIIWATDFGWEPMLVKNITSVAQPLSPETKARIAETLARLRQDN